MYLSYNCNTVVFHHIAYVYMVGSFILDGVYLGAGTPDKQRS